VINELLTNERQVPHSGTAGGGEGTQAWWTDDISSRPIFSYSIVILLCHIWKINAYGTDLWTLALIAVILLKQFFTNAWNKCLCLPFRFLIWQLHCHNLTACLHKYAHFMTIQDSICINIALKCSDSSSRPSASVFL